MIHFIQFCSKHSYISVVDIIWFVYGKELAACHHRQAAMLFREPYFFCYLMFCYGTSLPKDSN